MFHHLSDTVLDSRLLMVKELKYRFADDPKLEKGMMDMLDMLFEIHPDPTSASLYRLVIDQNDHQPAGGNVLVDSASGHLTGLLGEHDPL